LNVLGYRNAEKQLFEKLFYVILNEVKDLISLPETDFSLH